MKTFYYHLEVPDFMHWDSLKADLYWKETLTASHLRSSTDGIFHYFLLWTILVLKSNVNRYLFGYITDK